MNMVCLTKDEFTAMYKGAKQAELFAEIVKMGYSLEEIRADKAKMQKVVDAVHSNRANDKEEIELFVALFSQLEHYPEGSHVCLILKDGLDPRKETPTTFDELKAALKENEITDFGIMSDDGLRQFQLKQYRGPLTTDDLFSFIESKVRHYGNNLGETNLLVVLQSPEADLGNVDFDDMCTRLNKIGIKSGSEILLSFNEENKYDVIVRVFPEVGHTKKEHQSLAT